MSIAKRVLALAAPLLVGAACEWGPSLPQAVPEPPAAPAAAPAPGPAKIFGCGLPRGAGNGRSCPKESASFQGEIDEAIDKVVEDFPEFFDLGSTRGGPGNFRVLNVPQYVDEVVYNLRTMGFCALNDGEEIALKNSNDFNDQYDIITSQGYILRGYMATCYPAWNAIPPAGDGS